MMTTDPKVALTTQYAAAVSSSHSGEITTPISKLLHLQKTLVEHAGNSKGRFSHRIGNV